MAEDRIGRNIGVGCFTIFIGAPSGGMIAVFVGTMVAYLTRAPKCSGVPLCDWHYWMIAGAGIGAVSLPVLALWRLRRADARSDRAAGDTSNRG
jgi:hypothetical protein